MICNSIVMATTKFYHKISCNWSSGARLGGRILLGHLGRAIDLGYEHTNIKLVWNSYQILSWCEFWYLCWKRWCRCLKLGGAWKAVILLCFGLISQCASNKYSSRWFTLDFICVFWSCVKLNLIIISCFMYNCLSSQPKTVLTCFNC